MSRRCEIHCLGFLVVAHWIPPLGLGYGERRVPPRRFTFYWDWRWAWWPRPGYRKYRFWRPAR